MQGAVALALWGGGGGQPRAQRPLASFSAADKCGVPSTTDVRSALRHSTALGHPRAPDRRRGRAQQPPRQPPRAAAPM